MNKPKEITLIDKYYHIDNGGISVKLIAQNNGDDKYFIQGLKFLNSFFGYTTNEMTFHILHSEDKTNILEDLGKQLLTASQNFEKLNES